MDKDSIKFGKGLGLDLRQGRLEDFKFKTGSFDAVNLGDIIEHVKDPEGFLKECLRVLKKNGVLFVSTPNTNSLFPKITRWIYERLGIMWSHPTPPYHLFDFSDENLRRVLERNNVKVLGVDYSRISLMYSIYHTGYFDEMRKGMKGTSKGEVLMGVLKSFDVGVFRQIFVGLVYSFVFVLSGLFGKGDQVIVWGRKK